MEEFIKVTAVQDEDSHWYLIPSIFTNEFYKLVMDESRIDEFEDKFSQYRTGGDLNLTQLYILKPKN